jgi:hypothetical protein
MHNSAAQYFCALSSFVAWVIWVPSPVHADCANGRPQQRETCAYLSIGHTITNETAKADSLLINEAPALARRLTQNCLAAEQGPRKAPEQCWQSAAAEARRFTQGVTGAAAGELKAMSAVWTDLAQRLQQEQKSIAAQAPEARAIEPVSENFKRKVFSSRKDKKSLKRKVAAKSGKPKKSALAGHPQRQASSRSPRVRKAQLKSSFGKKQYAFAWRKKININKFRTSKHKPIVVAPNVKCLFGTKSCKK